MNSANKSPHPTGISTELFRLGGSTGGEFLLGVGCQLIR